jgi:hypothetical protein
MEIELIFFNAFDVLSNQQLCPQGPQVKIGPIKIFHIFFLLALDVRITFQLKKMACGRDESTRNNFFEI